MQENLNLFQDQGKNRFVNNVEGLNEKEKLEKERAMSKREGRVLNLAFEDTKEGIEIYVDEGSKSVIILEGVVGRCKLNDKGELDFFSLEGQVEESFSDIAKEKAKEILNNIVKKRPMSDDKRGAFIERSHPDNKKN
ncbi:MAG: hypothetical protein ABIG60_02930 [Patescibacteria group bacterium]